MVHTENIIFLKYILYFSTVGFADIGVQSWLRSDVKCDGWEMHGRLTMVITILDMTLHVIFEESLCKFFWGVCSCSAPEHSFASK